MHEVVIAGVVTEVNPSMVIAAFSGSLSSLVLAQPMPMLRAFLSVFTGLAFSVYTSPVFIHITGPPEWLHMWIVYISGAIGLKLLPVVADIAERFVVNTVSKYPKDKG